MLENLRRPFFLKKAWFFCEKSAYPRAKALFFEVAGKNFLRTFFLENTCALCSWSSALASDFFVCPLPWIRAVCPRLHLWSVQLEVLTVNCYLAYKKLNKPNDCTFDDCFQLKFKECRLNKSKARFYAQPRSCVFRSPSLAKPWLHTCRCQFDTINQSPLTTYSPKRSRPPTPLLLNSKLDWLTQKLSVE